MGSLHAGHVSLLDAARSENDLVAMSLFVNPTQFEASADLDRYPRQEGQDLEIAADRGADLVYVPEPADVYPAGFSTSVTVTGLTEVLEGSADGRGPSHFSGVTTVVSKLLNAFDPDRAYFGQKDAQQAAVIRRMVADLEFRTEIVVMPTIREEDGMPCSSRNALLDPTARKKGAQLSAILREAGRIASESGTSTGVEAARRELAQAGINPEYLEARNAETLEPIEENSDGPAMIVVAAMIGDVRLIDNVVIEETQPARSTR